MPFHLAFKINLVREKLMSGGQLPFTLRPDERILWSGRPKKIPFIGKSLIFTVIGLLFAIPATAVLLQISEAPALLLIPPLVIAAVGYLLAIVFPLRSVLSAGKVRYYITNQRIVILDGALEVSAETIEFSDLESVVIRRGFWDKKFGTSTLYLIIKGFFIHPSFSSIVDADRARRLIEGLLFEHRS